MLERKDPSLFITGPPGTGKSILLALKAVQWVKQGHHVHLPVLWQGSHLASHAIVRRAREVRCSLVCVCGWVGGGVCLLFELLFGLGSFFFPLHDMIIRRACDNCQECHPF